MMPRIGITARLDFDANGKIQQCLAASYLRAIEAAGGIPVLLPALESPSAPAIRCLLEGIDGILFSGGEDIDPLHYGEAPHPKLGRVSTERDATEIPLARLAFESSLPMLGICRGQQLINVALGGSLYQDIPSQLPLALNHQLPEDSALPLTSQTHHIQAEGLLASLCGADSFPANSSHHQAVKKVAAPLIASAWSDDGLIEALQAKDRKGFFLAVQSHPERLFDRSRPAWSAFFRAFVAAATR